ncbi:MAG: prepilin-type N-terminal cleavage/methylation domain-containing protein [Armatimonadota bacterium]|nr:prepilin-type N-terminal cleavage/methylation domain-containing protein [Armatimonadota bacterium]MDR7520766.1 prepilin-type N-terminal cleavage/methylation domain-containing protein [Armatimonadota bacterium]MDR7549237.1 prepilin-type N-terminal cleavage/methylation domain-containing protein [Armatimonadota bacterium]
MRHREAGVTLVELLVAAAIIAVALVPLLQVLPATLSPVQVSDVQLRLAAEATRKAEELIHRLRTDIDSVSSGAESCDAPADPADLPGCRVEWTIATEASSSAPGVGVLKAVGVIACQDRNGSGACNDGEEQVRYDTKVTSRP